MMTVATVSDSLAISEDRPCICGWSTDTLAIDHRNGIAEGGGTVGNEHERADPHTLLLFVPGNPGVIHWYTDALVRIVHRLGPGFAARGVSYAGHGVGEEVVGTDDDHNQSFCGEDTEHENDNTSKEKWARDMSTSWTMDGQVKHKIEWVDQVLAPFRSQSTSTPNLIFISHSIGAHFVQCMLLRRPDILAMTRHVIHLMPFIRFDPPLLNRMFLSSAAQSYKFTIPTMTALVRALSVTLPRNWIDTYLDKVVGVGCVKGRKITLDTFLNPNMMRNHLVLGFQEIRELPEYPNDVVLRLIASTQTSMLFCGGPDQWAPPYHMEDVRRMQHRLVIPGNVYTEYIESVRHDFVVHPEQIEPVVGFCIDRIKSGREAYEFPMRSRL